MGISAAVLIALGSLTFAQGYEVKPDLKIEVGAAARAAARIGHLRGTISHDETPAITIREDAKESDDSSAGIDPLPTGSIQLPSRVHKPKVEWDVFDKYGRPVKRY